MSAGNIDPLSVASLLVTPCFGDHALSKATAFVVSHEERVLLVTNWHVVTGRNPGTGQPLDTQTGAVPDALVVSHLHAENPPMSLQWSEVRYPLYDEHGDPLWLEHPRFGRNVDVVALPIPTAKAFRYDTYGMEAEQPRFLIGPTTAVSTIGFPFGQTAGGLFAVWTQGTIASEPAVDFNDRPCFLIDSRTRSGQSGSPVIKFHAGGVAPMADGNNVVMGRGLELLGVYSGRTSPESDLGLVWRLDALRDIVTGARRGPLPTRRS